MHVLYISICCIDMMCCFGRVFDRSIADALRGAVRWRWENRLWRLLLPHSSSRKTLQWHGQTHQEAKPPQPKSISLCPPDKPEGLSTQRPSIHLSRKSYFMFFTYIFFYVTTATAELNDEVLSVLYYNALQYRDFKGIQPLNWLLLLLTSRMVFLHHL